MITAESPSQPPPLCLESTARGKAGHSLSCVATVQGNLLVGKAYTSMLELRSGDEFEIKLGSKQIRLIPADGGDE
jgi:hypothetical protein